MFPARHEAEEADGLFHAALNHGAAHFRVTRNIVADDDEPQIFIAAVAFQFLTGYGKGFNQARDIASLPDGAGVEQEWITNR